MGNLLAFVVVMKDFGLTFGPQGLDFGEKAGVKVSRPFDFLLHFQILIPDSIRLASISYSSIFGHVKTKDKKKMKAIITRVRRDFQTERDDKG